MDIAIPVKKYESSSEVLSVGTHKLIFKNRTAGVIDPDNEKLKEYDNTALDLSYVSAGMSEKVVTLKKMRYNRRTAELSIIVEVTENPIPIIGIITAIGVFSLVALVWVSGAQIIYIPALAVIGVVAIYFYQEFK